MVSRIGLSTCHSRLRRLSVKFFGVVLKPSAGCADHGLGIMRAWKETFPTVPLSGCWPHIACSLSSGKGLRKCHPRHEEVSNDFRELHTCATTEMFNRLLMTIAKTWGDKDKAMNKLWNAFCDENANWHLGFCDAPTHTPSQQVQEAWHRTVKDLLKGSLRGTTKAVLEISLPKILEHDALMMSDELLFHLPREHIAPHMYDKAKWIVQAGEDAVRKVDDIYFVLSLSQEEHPKLTPELIGRCAPLSNPQNPR